MNHGSNLSKALSVLFFALFTTQFVACADYGEADDAFEDEPVASETAALTSGLPALTYTMADPGTEFLNPERGYYTGVNLMSPSNAAGLRAKGITLAIAIVRLDDYRNKSLDSTFLANLDKGFAAARAAGIKVILRFAYNASKTSDASKSRILGHIAQLKPYLVKNADVIAVMQAGFIGAWGEWHSSTNGLDNTADRTAIMNALLDALPTSRDLQVRTPMFKSASYGSASLSTSEAFGSTARARIGHHNDCFLASSSDMGTFASPVADWKKYVGDDGRFTPIGGETCAVSTYSACTNAVADMKAQHFSFLNKDYKPEVIAGFETGGCASSIRRRIGYRFTTTRVAHSKSVAQGGELEVELDLFNGGYATPFNRRPTYIVLTGNGVTYKARLSAAVDVRKWTSQSTTTIKTKLRIPSTLASGTYKIALWMPDHTDTLRPDSRYAIRLANPTGWDDATGFNILSTSVTVSSSAPGKKISGATEFAEIL
jgi:hypothetical protein